LPGMVGFAQNPYIISMFMVWNQCLCFWGIFSIQYWRLSD